MERKKFMDRAIVLSLKGSSEGKGGPFEIGRAHV